MLWADAEQSDATVVACARQLHRRLFPRRKVKCHLDVSSFPATGLPPRAAVEQYVALLPKTSKYCYMTCARWDKCSRSAGHTRAPASQHGPALPSQALPHVSRQTSLDFSKTARRHVIALAPSASFSVSSCARPIRSSGTWRSGEATRYALANSKRAQTLASDLPPVTSCGTALTRILIWS